MVRFLKAKHWQIFMITFGLPFIIEIIAMLFMFMGNNPMIIMKVMSLIMILLLFGFFGWFWAIAINLQQTLPDDLKLNTNKFKVFLFFQLIYMLIFFLFLDGSTIENESGPNPATFALIFIIHLFAMFCIFYCLYFVAKVFKTVELQRKVTFSDFAGEFFMILFFPIGIWIVQPKINKMIENKE